MDFQPTRHVARQKTSETSEHLFAFGRAVHFIIQFASACESTPSLVCGLSDRFVVAHGTIVGGRAEKTRPPAINQFSSRRESEPSTRWKCKCGLRHEPTLVYIHQKLSFIARGCEFICQRNALSHDIAVVYWCHKFLLRKGSERTTHGEPAKQRVEREFSPFKRP